MARIVTADEATLPAAAAELRAGGVLAFPTETVYGIGTLRGNAAGMEQMRRIKGRDAEKPFQILIPAPEYAEKCAEVSPLARRLIERFFPGPLTLVLPDGTGGTAGIRMPQNDWLLRLMKLLDCALVATSANRSGEPPATTASMAETALGEDLALIIDGGPSKVGAASTVAQLCGDKIKILRAGVIRAEDLQAAIL